MIKLTGNNAEIESTYFGRDEITGRIDDEDHCMMLDEDDEGYEKVTDD